MKAKKDASNENEKPAIHLSPNSTSSPFNARREKEKKKKNESHHP